MLYILRHARAAWSGDGDRRRPLSVDGELEARKLGKELKARGINFGLIITSTARRALQTTEIVSREVGNDCQVEFCDQFYSCTAGEVVDIIQKIDNEVETVLLVGHNPQWSDLVAVLAGDGRVYLDTCNFVALSHDGAWGGIQPGSCAIEYMITPRYI